MRELALVSKQPGPHADKQAKVERPDIPSILNRGCAGAQSGLVWRPHLHLGTGKCHYLAVILDLCARRTAGWDLSNKPDADLVITVLDVAYEQRGKPQGLLFHSDQGPPKYGSRQFRQWLWR